MTQFLHSYDPVTLFCTSCGRSAGWINTFDSACRDDVIPITHILARRSGAWLIAKLECDNWTRSR